MNFKYALILSFFSGIGSFIGTIILHYLLITTKRVSMRIVPLTIILIICCFIFPSFLIKEFYEIDDWKVFDLTMNK